MKIREYFFSSFFGVKQVYKKRYNIFICEAILKLNPILESSWNSLSVLVLIDIQSIYINTKKDYLCNYMRLYYQYIDIICITTSTMSICQSNEYSSKYLNCSSKIREIMFKITPSHCVFQLLSTMWSLLLIVWALTGFSTSSISSYHEDKRKKSLSYLW